MSFSGVILPKWLSYYKKAPLPRLTCELMWTLCTLFGSPAAALGLKREVKYCSHWSLARVFSSAKISFLHSLQIRTCSFFQSTELQHVTAKYELLCIWNFKMFQYVSMYIPCTEPHIAALLHRAVLCALRAPCDSPLGAMSADFILDTVAVCFAVFFMTAPLSQHLADILGMGKKHTDQCSEWKNGYRLLCDVVGWPLCMCRAWRSTFEQVIGSSWF